MIEELSSPWLESGETLLCFGDSLTECATGYVSMLEAKLAPKGISVINSGRGGDKTPWALGRLDTDVIPKHPDAVSIFLGANDAAVWQYEPRISPEAFKCNLEWIIHLLRLYGGVKKISLATPLPFYEGKTYEMRGNTLRPLCTMAREAAEEMHVLLVPLDVMWERETKRRESQRNPETNLLLTKDGVHPFAEGHQLIANQMLKIWNLL